MTSNLLHEVLFHIGVGGIKLLDHPPTSTSNSSQEEQQLQQQQEQLSDIQKHPSNYAFQLRWFVSDVLKGASPFVYTTQKVEDGKEVKFDYGVDFELENRNYNLMKLQNSNTNNISTASKSNTKNEDGQNRSSSKLQNENQQQQPHGSDATPTETYIHNSKNHASSSSPPTISVSHLLQLSVVACSQKMAKSIEAGFNVELHDEVQILGVLMIDLNAHVPKYSATTASSQSQPQYELKISSQKATLYLSRSPLTPPPLMRISIRGEPAPSSIIANNNNNNSADQGRGNDVPIAPGNVKKIDSGSNYERRSSINSNNQNNNNPASPPPVKPRTYSYSQPQQQQQQQLNNTNSSNNNSPKQLSSTTTPSSSRQPNFKTIINNDIDPTTSVPARNNDAEESITQQPQTQHPVTTITTTNTASDDIGPFTLEHILRSGPHSFPSPRSLRAAFDAATAQLRALTEQGETHRREHVALQRRSRLQQEELGRLREQVSEAGVGRVRAAYEARLFEMKEEIAALVQANVDLRSMSQTAEILADSLALELEQCRLEAREGVALARDSQRKLDDTMDQNDRYERAIKHGQEEIVKLHAYCAQAKGAFEDAMAALQKERTENAVNKRRVEDLQKLLDASRLIRAKENETILPLR